MEAKKVLLKLLHSGMTKQELRNSLKKSNIREIKIVLKNISENTYSISGQAISKEELERMKDEEYTSAVFPVVCYTSESIEIANSEESISM